MDYSRPDGHIIVEPVDEEERIRMERRGTVGRLVRLPAVPRRVP